MKVLFICPPIKFTPFKIHPRDMPLLLSYVAAAVRKVGTAVRILDAFLHRMGIDEITAEVEKYNPDFIGIALYDYSREVPEENSLFLAKELKKKFSHIKIGLLWSYNIEYIVGLLETNNFLDYVIFGEPEITAMELYERKNFCGVKGVVYRDDLRGNVHINEARELIENLDVLPFPARDLLSIEKYTFIPHKYKSPVFMTILTTRGCPFGCKFCFREFYPRSYRTRSVDNVIEEIIYLEKTYKIREIHFEDPIFGLERKWLVEFCKKLTNEKLNITWTCLMRVNMLDEETTNLMKISGCRSVLLGIETANDYSLELLNKNIDIPGTYRTVGLLKKAKIDVIASFLLGVPGETVVIAKKTVDFAIKLNPDYVQFFLLRIYRYDGYFKKFGTLEGWEDTEYDFRGPIFLPEGYKNIDELKKIQKYAYRKFYFRLSYIMNKLLKISSISDIERYLYGAKILLKIR